MGLTVKVKGWLGSLRERRGATILRALALSAGAFLVVTGVIGLSAIAFGELVYFVGSIYTIIFGLTALVVEVKHKLPLVGIAYEWIDTYLKFLTVQRGKGVRRVPHRATCIKSSLLSPCVSVRRPGFLSLRRHPRLLHWAGQREWVGPQQRVRHRARRRRRAPRFQGTERGRAARRRGRRWQQRRRARVATRGEHVYAASPIWHRSISWVALVVCVCFNSRPPR